MKNKQGYKNTELGWIPEEWEVKKLTNICNLSAGATPNTKIREYWGGEISWMNSGELNLRKVKKVKNYITQLGFEKSSTRLIPINSILIGLAGQGKTRGTVAINEIELTTNQSIAAIIPKTELLYFEYLFYVLDSMYKEIRNLSSGDGGRGGLNLKLLNSLKLPIPPLQEQKKIAKILSTWDKAIENIEKLFEAKTQLLKGLMQKLLTGKIRFKEFENEKVMIQTINGKVPKDWKYLKASEIFERHSQNSNGVLELLSVTQDRGVIPRYLLDGRVTMPSGSTESFKLVSIGDFVIGLRSFEGGIEYSEYNGLVSPAYTVLKSKIPIKSEYYKYYFKSKDFISKLAVAVIGIRDGKQISYDDFGIIKLFYPSLIEQEKISFTLQTLDKELEIIKSQLIALKEQKKGLMQKLLIGEVRVKIEEGE